MSDEERQELMLELVERLQELFPNMSNIATDDLLNPTFLMISDDNNFNAFAELLGAANVEVRESSVGEELSLDKVTKKLLGWDGGNDSGNGGILQ